MKRGRQQYLWQVRAYLSCKIVGAALPGGKTGAAMKSTADDIPNSAPASGEYTMYRLDSSSQ